MAVYTVGPGKTYSTIQGALDALYAAVSANTFTETQTIDVYTATYTETPTPNSNLKPTSDFRLIITAHSGETPVIDAQSTRQRCVYVLNIAYVTVSGFEMKNATAGGLYMNGTSSYGITNNNIVHDCVTYGIVFYNGANHGDAYNNVCYSNGYGIAIFTNTAYCNVYSNECYSNSSYGLYIAVNCANTTAYNNNFHNNTSYGIYTHSSTILSIHDNIISSNTNGIGFTNTSSGGFVYNNTCTGSTTYSIIISASNTCLVYNNSTTGGSNGIYLSGSTGCTVYNNFIINHTNLGITASSSGNSLIYNNLIISSIYGVSLLGGSNGCQVFNNTIYNNSNSGVSATGTTTGCTVKNNSIWNTAGYCLKVDASSQSGFNSDYNNLYYSGTGKTGYWGTTAYTTLANWISASSQDAHSINADPSFMNTGGTTAADYKFQYISPCRNAGTDLSAYLTTDYYGTTRPQETAYDVGFYEFPYLQVAEKPDLTAVAGKIIGGVTYVGYK